MDKTNAVVVFIVGTVRFPGMGNCQSCNKQEHNVVVDHLASSGTESADDNGEVVDEFAGISLSLYRGVLWSINIITFGKQIVITTIIYCSVP